ncbi:unnamed protein product [Symbiodinium microadriaticum]|nr:unnamed protein product [Symbiodinium microadriaticum]
MMPPTRADASRSAPSPKRGLRAACVSLFCCAALRSWCCATQSKKDTFVAAAPRPMRAPGAWASCLLRRPEPPIARPALPEAATAASAAVFVAAAVFARVQENGSGGNKLLKEAGPFRFYVDRCLINFDQAFCQLAATESSLPAKIPVFTFFDGYFPVPELDSIPSKAWAPGVCGSFSWTARSQTPTMTSAALLFVSEKPAARQLSPVAT